MQPLRISRMTRRIDDFQFRMNRVCRLLGYMPNAHRDPISINQNSNKKSPGVKLFGNLIGPAKLYFLLKNFRKLLKFVNYFQHVVHTCIYFLMEIHGLRGV